MNNSMIAIATMCVLMIFLYKCVVSASIINCYEIFGGYYLSNSGNMIIPNLTNVNSCLQKCTNADILYGFLCRSAMFIYEHNDCILSEWNRKQRPNRFTYTKKFGINYYERKCGLEEETVNESERINSSSIKSVQLNFHSVTSMNRQTHRKGKNNDTRHNIRLTRRVITNRRPIIYQQNIVHSKSGQKMQKWTLSTQTSSEFTLPAARFVIRRAISLHNISGHHSGDISPNVRRSLHITQSAVNYTAIRPGPIIKHRPIRPVNTVNTVQVPLHVMTSSESDSRITPLSDEVIDENGISRSAPEKKLNDLMFVSLSDKGKLYLKNITQCFKNVPNRELIGFNEETIIEISVDDCLQRCLQSTKAFVCLSVNYNRITMSCKLNDGSVYLNDAELRPSSQVDYYEAICLLGIPILEREDVLNDSRKGYPSRSWRESELFENVAYNTTKFQECFTVRENVIVYELNGFVAENVTSLGECLLTCGSARSTQKTPCYSFNWFKLSRKCFIHAVPIELTSLRYSTTSDFYLNSCNESDISAINKPSNISVNNDDYYDSTH